jgi:hypothetical protein
MATYTYDALRHIDEAKGQQQSPYAYDSSRSGLAPVNPGPGCRTNMTYDTGPREGADQPLIVTVPPAARPGESAG